MAPEPTEAAERQREEMIPGPEGIDAQRIETTPGTLILGERRVLGPELDADLNHAPIMLRHRQRIARGIVFRYGEAPTPQPPPPCAGEGEPKDADSCHQRS